MKNQMAEIKNSEEWLDYKWLNCYHLVKQNDKEMNNKKYKKIIRSIKSPLSNQQKFSEKTEIRTQEIIKQI